MKTHSIERLIMARLSTAGFRAKAEFKANMEAYIIHHFKIHEHLASLPVDEIFHICNLKKPTAEKNLMEAEQK